MRKFLVALLTFAIVFGCGVLVVAAQGADETDLITLASYHEPIHEVFGWGVRVSSMAELEALIEGRDDIASLYDDAFFEGRFLILYNHEAWNRAPYDLQITSIDDDGVDIHIAVGTGLEHDPNQPPGPAFFRTAVIEVDNTLVDRAFTVNRWCGFGYCAMAYISLPTNEYEIKYNVVRWESLYNDDTPFFSKGVKIASAQDLTNMLDDELPEFISRYDDSFFENYFLVVLQTIVGNGSDYIRVTSARNLGSSFDIELSGRAVPFPGGDEIYSLWAILEIDRELWGMDFTLNGRAPILPFSDANHADRPGQGDTQLVNEFRMWQGMGPIAGVNEPFRWEPLAGTNLRVGVVSARAFAYFINGSPDVGVNWDAATNTATVGGSDVHGNAVSVVMTVGSNIATVNGSSVDIATFADQSGPVGSIQVVPTPDGLIFLPLRFLANAFDRIVALEDEVVVFR